MAHIVFTADLLVNWPKIMLIFKHIIFSRIDVYLTYWIHHQREKIEANEYTMISNPVLFFRRG